MTWKPGLDVLRSFAIIIVLFSHWEFINEFSFYTSIKKSFFSGVDLFFVLSGFLIASQWFHSLDNNKKSIFKVFYAKRLFRITPLYLVFLALEISKAEFVTKIPYNFFAYLTLTQNLFGYTIFPVSWSLCIEEHFYLVFPLLSWFLFKKFDRKVFFYVLIILVIYPLALRYHYFINLLDNTSLGILDRIRMTWPEHQFGFQSTAFRIEGISFGVLLAYIKNYQEKFWDKLLNGATYLNIIGILLVALGVYFCAYENSVGKFVFSPFLFAIGYGLILIYADKSSSLINRKSFKFFEVTARIAYPLYLFHMLSWFLLKVALKRIGPIDEYSRFALGMIICYFGAYLLNKFIEQPLLEKRKSFIKSILN